MGIKLTSNFDQQAALPLDSRATTASVASRDSIPSSIRYEGLLVYVEDTATAYMLAGGITNGEWKALGVAEGNMKIAQYDSNGNGIVDNAEKINGFTVAKSVPADALFTDTIYDDSDLQSRTAVNDAKVSNVDHPLVEKAVPSNAVFTDTLYDDTNVVKAPNGVLPALDGSNLTNLPTGATVTSTPVSGSTEAISAGWAFDNVKTAVPSGAVFTDTVYSHPSVSHIPSGGSVGQVLGFDSAGTAKWITSPTGSTDLSVTVSTSTITIASSTGNDVTIAAATTSAAGLMSKTDKIKLTGLVNYDDSAVLKDSDTVSAVTSSNKLLTQAEIGTIDTYQHPTGPGNKHVPANGTTNDGKVLTATATDGVVTWQNVDSLTTSPDLSAVTTDTTVTITNTAGADAVLNLASTTAAGLISPSEKNKINGFTQYEHPTTAGYKHIPSGGANGQALVWGSDGLAIWGTPAAGSLGSLSDVNDMNIDNPSAGDVIQWNGSQWVNIEGPYSAKVQTITTDTVFVDATTAKNYKMYINNARIVLEEL